MPNNSTSNIQHSTSKDFVLSVSDISKSFKDYSSEFKRILSWFGFDFKATQEHKILKHINFSISSGEAVGIVGQNGAGKSTLLKMITSTLKPTSGKIIVRGRISAILELGMGFNPDLTGRQNAYNTSGIMGYNNTEIDNVIDDIELFADIGEYFDHPIRTYSSGMQARVAFSVATAFRPEILIVDEALSVGDTFFGLKCIERMEKFQKDGTSILLVTHDMGTLRRFCDKGIVLEHGKKVFEGDVLKAISMYSLQGRTLNEKDTKIIDFDDNKQEDEVSLENVNFIPTHFSPNIAEIKYLHLFDTFKNQTTIFEQDNTLNFDCSFNLLQDLSVPYLHITIINAQNSIIYAKNSFQNKLIHKQSVAKDNTINLSGKFELALAPGKYIFALALHSVDKNILELDGQSLINYLDEHRKVILSAKVEIEIITKEDGLAFYGLVDLPTFWDMKL